MPQSGLEDGKTVVPSSLDTLAEEASAKLPGAIETYITSQLKYVIKDFFRQSTSWRMLLGPYTISSATPFQQLDPNDAMTEVILVLGVNRGRYSMGNIGSGMARLSLSGNTSPPDVYYTDPPDTINLPSDFTGDVEDIYAEVAVQPTFETDVLLPWVFDQYHEAFLAGLYARMFLEMDKPYSSATLAAYYLKKYRQGISAGKILAQKNYTTTEHKWAFPRWTR